MCIICLFVCFFVNHYSRSLAQGLEGYFRNPGFGQNTGRDLGNVIGIRDVTKIQCEIRETLSGYEILMQLGNRDSPKFVHACGIGKEKDIQNSDDGSSGCEIPEKGSGNAGPPSPDPVSNTKQRQSCRPLYTLGLKTALQLNMRR